MRERAEDKARLAVVAAQQAQQQQLAHQQMFLAQARQPQGFEGGRPAPVHQAEPLETWLEETMSMLELPPPPSPVPCAAVMPAWHQPCPATVAQQQPPVVMVRQLPALQGAAAAPPPGGLERQQQASDDLARALAALGQ